MTYKQNNVITDMLSFGRKTAFTPVHIRDGHDNFFTPLRIFMAVMVVIGHSSAIAMRDINAEPYIFLHYTFSYIAVNLFFVASGFLVTKSMAYRGDLADFGSARILRIYPALIAHVLFLIFIIGPLSTTLNLWEFFSSPDVWKQPLIVLTFIDTAVIMPGVFAGNEEPMASGALWTLRYEFMAYIATALAFSLGLMKRKWMILAQFVIPSCLWLLSQKFGIYEALPATLQSLLRFGIAYGLGAALYAYRDRISFNFIGVIGMGLFALLLGKTPLVEVSTNMFLAYILMYFAYVKAPKFNGLQKLSDVSYGIYIYHWCILQLAFEFWPDISIMQLVAIALPTSYILATISWHWIEKPMLKSKSKFAKWLRFGGKPVQFDTSKVLLD